MKYYIKHMTTHRALNFTSSSPKSHPHALKILADFWYQQLQNESPIQLFVILGLEEKIASWHVASIAV